MEKECLCIGVFYLLPSTCFSRFIAAIMSSGIMHAQGCLCIGYFMGEKTCPKRCAEELTQNHVVAKQISSLQPDCHKFSNTSLGNCSVFIILFFLLDI